MNPPFTVCVTLLMLAVPLTAWSRGPDPVSAPQLIAWLKTAEPPVVIDVRGREAYRSGSLPGAVNAGTDPRGYLPDHSGDPVVLLTARAADSARIEAWTARLAAAGHPVWLLTGGMAAWIAQGGPVERPEAAYARPGTVPFLIPKGLCEGGEPAQVFE